MRAPGLLPAAILLLALPSAVRAADSAAPGPLSGRPASMGGAYGPLAEDAYAPLWNPAGLGRLGASQLAVCAVAGGASGQSGSLVHPLGEAQGLGAALQFARPEQDARLALFSLAYGRVLSDRLSLGAAAKVLEAKGVAGASRAAGADLGALYRFENHLSASAGIDNMGGRPSSLERTDELQTTPRLGAAYSPAEGAVFSMEWLQKRGKAGLRTGVELRVQKFLALRAGLDTLQNPSGSNRLGLTAGLGIALFGQELDYAYLPQSRLGRLQSLSFVMRLGHSDSPVPQAASPALPEKFGLKPARFSRSEERDVEPGQEFGTGAPTFFHATPAN